MVGTASIDDVLTSGKIAIENEIKDKLVQCLDKYGYRSAGSGSKNTGFKPPTEEIEASV